MTTKTTPVHSFRTSVDIPTADRAKISAVLNQHLADAFDLWSQAKQAHWNVKGPDFWQLHKLFDEVADEAAAWVDQLAERVTALGGYANGTVRMAAATSTLPEFPTDISDSMDFVSAVGARLATFTNAARAAIDRADKLGDADTADLLTEISRCADKYLYFLEAHLQD
ncbi:MAG: DNA starvation/stationary phase protection protein Dps [Chloroflexota bacterium]